MFSLVVNAEEADHSVCSLETTPGSHSLSSLSFLSSLYSFPSLNWRETEDVEYLEERGGELNLWIPFFSTLITPRTQAKDVFQESKGNFSKLYFDLLPVN